MRTLTRALAVACATALTVPAWGLPAHAETVAATETAAYGGYFSSTGIRKPDESPANIPNATANADGVSPGRLAVGARANQNDKISFLYFQLADVPFGSTLSKALLTVPLVPSDPQNATYAAEPVKVQACPAGPEGFFGEDGAAMQDAPTFLCEKASATAVLSADGKAYEFDVTNVAAAWAEANDGLALVPTDGARTTPFQVVFEKAELATLSYEYTPEDDSALLTGDFGDLGAATGSDATTSFDTGGLAAGGDTGSFDLGGGLGTSTAQLDGALPAGPLPEAEDPAGAPAVAAEQAASAGPIEILRPTVGFWLMALLLGGVLAFLGLVMGDSRSPALAASATPSRLSRALAAQQRGGAASALAGPSR